MKREIINTPDAPTAVGTYSQAVKIGDTVYLSGQIPLQPDTMQIVAGGIEAQLQQVLINLKAVAEAAGGTLDHVVKLNIFLTDLSHFSFVNALMPQYFSQPYPARAVIGVAALPKNAMVEIDAIIVL